MLAKLLAMYGLFRNLAPIGKVPRNVAAIALLIGLLNIFIQLAMLFARLVTDQHPDIATTTRAISKRAGKVYVDAFQNRAGQLMVAPYSVRPSPKAPVSMPIEWDEVNGKLHNTNFTIANALKRMEKLGHDPVLPVLDLKPNLVGVLERLNERLK